VTTVDISMLTYPDIDPIAFSLGPLSVRWYGLTYLVGFAIAFSECLCRGRVRNPPWSPETIADLFCYCAPGVVLGGTVGYLVFYEPSYLWENPLSAFKFWEPGRSFHGGLIGVVVAIALFSRREKRSFLEIADFITPAVPIGLGFGRLGNFLNGELWGRVTTMPWGMVFPQAGILPRHPSQFYELFLEGIVLFLLLAVYSRKPKKPGSILAVFLLWYGLFRIFVECFREPDAMQGLMLGGWFTMGQLLSVPMLVCALILFCYPKKIPDWKESSCNSTYP